MDEGNTKKNDSNIFKQLIKIIVFIYKIDYVPKILQQK